MGQNQDEKTGVADHCCDSCGRSVSGKEPFLLLPVASIWGGIVGPGMLLCVSCAKDKLGLDVEAHLHA